jgi:hypothetical protein
LQFLGFFNHGKGVWGKKFRSDQWFAAHFREVGGAL